MSEIKKASVGADAMSNMQLEYITKQVINQEILGKSIASELAAYEAIGRYLADISGEFGVLDKNATDYMNGQGRAMLRVVWAIQARIKSLTAAAEIEREWNE